MSKALSLKLREDIFETVENITRAEKIPRNTYINRALEFYNAINKKRMLKKQLEKESKLVQATSMEVLEEFEKIDDNFFE
ncbi:hypothetical protein COY07_04845 [Candidatus Peregrinibacteria bacterium CG_4_10_14_0_2_um_filter_43_11]|nr:MAG: hypothetical protein COY07_04845 [Candidatus Peregrinibacteria bacterium CG_4_10_14_0_2_um_filter_43_11]